MDEIPIPLKGFVPCAYPSDDEVLTRLGETERAAEALRKAEAFAPGREHDPLRPRERGR